MSFSPLQLRADVEFQLFLFVFSEPHFPHLSNGDDKTYLTELYGTSISRRRLTVDASES